MNTCQCITKMYIICNAFLDFVYFLHFDKVFIQFKEDKYLNYYHYLMK